MFKRAIKYYLYQIGDHVFAIFFRNICGHKILFVDKKLHELDRPWFIEIFKILLKMYTAMKAVTIPNWKILVTLGVHIMEPLLAAVSGSALGGWSILVTFSKINFKKIALVSHQFIELTWYIYIHFHCQRQEQKLLLRPFFLFKFKLLFSYRNELDDFLVQFLKLKSQKVSKTSTIKRIEIY